MNQNYTQCLSCNGPVDRFGRHIFKYNVDRDNLVHGYDCVTCDDDNDKELWLDRCEPYYAILPTVQLSRNGKRPDTLAPRQSFLVGFPFDYLHAYAQASIGLKDQCYTIKPSNLPYWVITGDKARLQAIKLGAIEISAEKTQLIIDRIARWNKRNEELIYGFQKL